MRLFDRTSFVGRTRWAFKCSFAAAVCLAGAACRDDYSGSTGVLALGPLASVQVSLIPIEPFASATALLDLRDPQNRPVTQAGANVLWMSSDTTIATVVGGLVTGRLPGDAVITATIRGLSGSTVAHIAWGPGTKLRIAQGPLTASLGDRVVFSPSARTPLSPGELEWTSSNEEVARLDGPGTFTAIEPGATTIIGRVAGLVDSVRVDVVRGDGSFGYYYSSDAEAESYDDTFWSPPGGKYYSTSGSVHANWGPPYASRPDLGWVGPFAPAPGAMLHVVSLESMACTAFLKPEEGYGLAATGSPLVECRDRAGTPGIQSVRMEFVAFRVGEFNGHVAIARPDGSMFMTDSGTIRETVAGAGVRDYTVTGVSRDSLFWFVTPGASSLSTCATEPLRNLPQQTAVRVICAGIKALAVDALAYVVGFGPDARRGSAPVGFIEIGERGVIARKVVSGLEIASTGTSLRSLVLTVSGAQLAAFDRIPAVLVTAIGSTADVCALKEGVREPTSVQFYLTCPASVAGATIGIIY